VKTQLQNQQHTGVKKNPLQDEATRLAGRVVEVAKRFPHVEAVCHEVDRGVLAFILCAPGIGLDEEFDLTQKLLSVLDCFDEIDADFFVSSRSGAFYRSTGMSVVQVR